MIHTKAPVLPSAHACCPRRAVQITGTCVRVPVMRAHAESINLEFEKDISVDQVGRVHRELVGDCCPVFAYGGERGHGYIDRATVQVGRMGQEGTHRDHPRLLPLTSTKHLILFRPGVLAPCALADCHVYHERCITDMSHA